MPTQLKLDNKGYYYQWGNHGYKYYFKTKRGSIIARNKADRQGKAIYSSGYRGK